MSVKDSCKVRDIVVGHQFRLVLYSDGSLYSWGINNKGCLGIGKEIHHCHNQLVRVDIEDVVEVKLGANHVLALTKMGEVYAWGDNSRGQVGFKKFRDNNRTDKIAHSSVIYSPKKVYPPAASFPRTYKKAIQIAAYENTSFLLTDGLIPVKTINLEEEEEIIEEPQTEYHDEVFGWGHNDHGILLSPFRYVRCPYRLDLGVTSIERIDVQDNHVIGYSYKHLCK